MSQLTLASADREFVEEVRTWLEEHLTGEFAKIRGKGGTGQEDIAPELLIAWEKELASGGWLGLDYPEEYGGKSLSLMQQVLFFTTYVEARAPGRMPNMGVTLLGPTLLAFGTDMQKERFLPKILSGQEFWCQGYSEPDAGSDLANVSTSATLQEGRWVINGQKVWTSLAQFSDWCFVVCRTEPGTSRHKGLSYLLVPMNQEGVEIRPIIQITGGDEFNEVFFNDAVADADMIVGEAGNGWAVAMGTLEFERGASTLGQQLSFQQEFDALMALAKASGGVGQGQLRDALARSYCLLEIMRYNNMRILSSITEGNTPGPEMSIGKLYWTEWHQKFAELGMHILGADGMTAGGKSDGNSTGISPADVSPAGISDSNTSFDTPPSYPLSRLQRTFLYSRAHTIYAGSSEIQKNIIAERVLGLPR